MKRYRSRLLLLLWMAATVPVLFFWPAAPVASAQAAGAALAPTPADTEGPYYKRGSPRRTSLREPGTAGPPLTITGRVLSTDGTPLVGAKLDFWQTDAEGDYDNRGYRFRGHQYTEAAGRYRLETVVPEAYSGRTRHIHVKVEAPGHRRLTTQLYFPGDARNRRDFLYQPALEVRQVRETDDGLAAHFDFVLQPSR